jgi:NAD(P)-dependent dehydrogenase (short-subunit alcohol dehydrogenase family)
VARWIEEEFGRLDILVNNAGIFIDDAPPSGLDMGVLRHMYETNVFGPVAVIKAMLPLLRKSSAGRIVNMSSGLGSLTLTSDPGWRFADLNNHQGTQSVEQGARAAVHLATLSADGSTGGFFDQDGTLPW